MDNMDAIKALMERVSTRKFSDRHIADEELKIILEAAMAGPSATNARPFAFIVVRDRQMLEKMADANMKYSEPLRGADVGILVCGDLERAYKAAPDFWVVDGSIAAQNMILAAHALGIGSCWLGTWPVEERINNHIELFNLPENIIPHSLIAFGYPEGEFRAQKDRYEEDRVHYEKW